MPKGAYKRTEYHNKISRKNGFKKGNHPKTEFKKGQSSLRKGVKMSEKQKRKIRNTKIKANLKGKNSWMWRGGDPNYPVDWTETLKRSIRERDRYICKLCSTQQGDRAFDVHHIDYDKKNNNPNNLISLCNSCHSRTNHNREYWTNYFKFLLA